MLPLRDPTFVKAHTVPRLDRPIGRQSPYERLVVRACVGFRNRMGPLTSLSCSCCVAVRGRELASGRNVLLRVKAIMLLRILSQGLVELRVLGASPARRLAKIILGVESGHVALTLRMYV